MALRNGLLIHGPTHWAAAVRDRDGDDPGRLRAQAGAGAEAGRARCPGLRGPLKLAEAMAVLPLARRRLPAARLPFEDWRVIAAVGATLAATAAAAPRAPASALREGVAQAIGAVPAMVALMDRDLAAYHGVEHKAIAAYEQGIDDVAAVPKEHDRCGSNLIVADDAALGRRHGPARAPGRAARAPLARAGVGLGGASIAVEMFAWSDRHHGDPLAEAFHTPGREIQRHWATKEPTPEQLEVGLAAMAEILRVEQATAGTTCRRPHRLPPMFGRIDHIGVAVEDLDAAIALYEQQLRDAARPPRDGRGPGRRGGAARRRRGPRRAAARRSAPTPPSASSSPSKGPGLHHVAYAVDDIDATLARLAAAGIELIDSEPRVGIRDSRVAFLHPRSTGGVLTEIVEPAGGH